MNQLSALFLVCSLVLSVTLGAQTRSWSWGIPMVLLALSVLSAIPSFLKKPHVRGNDWIITLLGFFTAAWIAWRALASPVQELAMADVFLLAAAVGAYLAAKVMLRQELSGRIFVWSVAALLVADLAVLAVQVADPRYSPLYAVRPANLPSGFFGHYNDGANFLLAASFLLAGVACFGREGKVSRILLGLLSLLGLVAIYFTRSRGGILAAAVGATVFLVFALMYGKRKQSAWFVPLAIITPILGILAVGFLLKGWASAQEFRFQANVDTVMDNPIRLFLLGIAFSCISLHPWAGGGSRSYSWECYRIWEFQDQGGAAARPEMVHNELVQSATDYGLIGAGLISVLLVTILLIALIRAFSTKASSSFHAADGWRAGATAALAGMICQSNFSFVFHMLPGAMLLGLCMALATSSSHEDATGENESAIPYTSWLNGLIGIGCGIFLLPAGWINTRISLALLPAYLKSTDFHSEIQEINQLTAALTVWPQATFYKDRAFLYQKLSTRETGEISPDFARDQAIADYQSAIALHPYDATLTVNLANLLSASGNYPQAEFFYEKSLELQGGMEPGFHGHASYADHLLKKGTQQLRDEHPAAALQTFNAAAEQLDRLNEKAPWILFHAEGIQLKTGIYEGLGLACAAEGDFTGAMEAFELMVKDPQGAGGYYRMADSQSQLAAKRWAERRPAEALSLLLKARENIRHAQKLPTGISESQKLELKQYIDQSIAFLEKARIAPSPMEH